MSTAYCPNPDPASLRCLACGRPCEVRANGWQHARPRCGAPMRYGERCARTPGHAVSGHGHGHRTRYALDCQAESRRAA